MPKSIAHVYGHSVRPDGSKDAFWGYSVPAKWAPLWWQEKGLSYTDSGYGARIPSPWLILFNGKWRRVYVRQYSNAGTCYIGKLTDKNPVFVSSID